MHLRGVLDQRLSFLERKKVQFHSWFSSVKSVQIAAQSIYIKSSNPNLFFQMHDYKCNIKFRVCLTFGTWDDNPPNSITILVSYTTTLPVVQYYRDGWLGTGNKK